MKWPQFELWRLFAAVALVSVALACCLLVYPSERPDITLFGIVLLLGAIGTLFKKGMLFALGVPVILLLLVMLYSIVQSWIRAIS